MNTQDKIHDLEAALVKISHFRTSSFTSIILMVVGVAVIIGAVAFSISRLRPLERQTDELQSQTADLVRQSDQLREELKATQQKLDNTLKQAEKVRLGTMDTQARKYDRAISTFDEAIALDPSNANVYNYKGYAQYRAKQYDAAIKTFQTCFEIEPGNVWCHYNAALAFWNTGKEEQGVAEVRKTVDLDPTFREIFKNDVQFAKFKSSAEYRKVIEDGK